MTARVPFIACVGKIDSRRHKGRKKAKSLKEELLYGPPAREDRENYHCTTQNQNYPHTRVIKGKEKEKTSRKTVLGKGTSSPSAGKNAVSG